MKEWTLFVNNKAVDVIEIFDDYYLVQDVDNKNIYLVHYCQIDCEETKLYNNDSNIISFEGWKKWRKKEKKNISLKLKSDIVIKKS